MTDSNDYYSDESYYTVLGVQPNASDKDIRKAYLKLSLRCHPDKNPAPDAQQQFVRIGRAYEVLSQDRTAYDRARRRNNSGSYARPYASSTSFAGAASYARRRANHPQPQQQQQEYASYDSYRQAFDATMAGLSEDELNELRGVAAVVGGLIGSLVGARLSTSNNVLLRTMGAVVGSQLVSEAATSLVEVAHAQATERVERGAVEQDSTSRLARSDSYGCETKSDGGIVLGRISVINVSTVTLRIQQTALLPIDRHDPICTCSGPACHPRIKLVLMICHGTHISGFPLWSVELRRAL